MDAEQLRQLQSPIKQKYRENPDSAQIVLKASGSIAMDRLACDVPTFAGATEAGLHSAAGGNGSQACSGDMLLEALVACSGVTFAAVATAMSIPIASAHVIAEGQMDFRGTLGTDKSVSVGLKNLRLKFQIESPATDQELAKLVELTERYCVVLQTLAAPAELQSGWTRPC